MAEEQIVMDEKKCLAPSEELDELLLWWQEQKRLEPAVWAWLQWLWREL